MLAENTVAPDFTLPDGKGNAVSLSSFKGKKVVVYFYPKDNTAGCTRQACAFAADYSEYAEMGVVVIGISKDSQKSHTNFTAKNELNFTLLSDSDHSVMEQYGAWGEKKMYGKTTLGVIRCTYIINPEGIIEKTFPKVITATHGEQIRKYFDSLNK